MSNGWLTEGTAHRSPVQRTPVIHLLIAETEVMWCSGGKGREDSPHGTRFCRKCRDLARDAVAAGDLDAADFTGRGWDIDVPVERLPEDTILCRWYALCDKPAEGTVEHPVLGPVACCGRCARKHSLVLTPA